MGTTVDTITTGTPLWISGQEETFRRTRGITQAQQAGAMSATGFKATEMDTPGMGVKIAAGYLWVPGTDITGPEGQHNYGVPLTAADNLTGITAPVSATRTDQIVLRVYDEVDAPGPGKNAGEVQYIANSTETTTPEAVPDNAIRLALVELDVAQGSILDADITDVREFAGPTIVGEDGTLYTLRVDEDGRLVLRDRTNAAEPAAGFGFPQAVEVYESDDTWTKADYTNLQGVKVTVIGSGSGGQSISSNGFVGAGGGGGGGTIKWIPAGDLGATETVTVGEGGTASNPGETSSFGSHCQATGGADPASYTPTLGGVGSGGHINVSGGTGGAGELDAEAADGKGGDGAFGMGAGGPHGVLGGNGTVGTGYGAGGGGGHKNTSTDRDGGAGSDGVVIVEVY